MTTSPVPAPQIPVVPQAAIDELRRRLDAARWPDVVDESASVHGISVATVRGWPTAGARASTGGPSRPTWTGWVR